MPATPTPSSVPATATMTVTPDPTAGAIQMPLLPSTATSEPLPPTPTPTVRSGPLLSADSAGWLVVVVILVLTAVVGLVLGRGLRNLAQRS
jgi:hypothetical protein